MPLPKPVVPLTPAHLPHAALLLARAFQDDPFYTTVLPDPARRMRLLPWLQERLLRYGLCYGTVYTTPALEGAAIWLGPEHPAIRPIGALRTGLFLLPLHLGLGEFRRSLRLSAFADRLHRRCAPSRHLYLLEIGVEPALQGQGIGSALLRVCLEQADRQALVCYLETNEAGNVPYYAGRGFVTAAHGQASPGGAQTWAMLREPA
ncbi:MAG TPA: GNAT family N-acetyltransferase [Anaerolineales bacterium]|nr:GNAT family N-acetyltransferase [Anaerolineales bacterium]